jgi:hypothetical protein
MPRKGTVKSAGLRATTAPMPQALNQFIDQNAGYGGHTGIGGRSPALVEPPEFRPSSTFAGGVGGGFGTGGGFGSTGGFHTVRAAAWQEPTLIRLNDPEPLPVPEASEWAPSRLAPGVAHMVNKVRANTSGQQKLQGVVDDSLVAGPPQHTGTGDGSQYVMEPERFEFFQVRVPPTTTVMPPPAISRQDRLMAPADRSAILQFEKQKRTADIVLGRDRHRQMRHIALMQRRYPTGVRPKPTPVESHLIPATEAHSPRGAFLRCSGWSLLRRKERSFMQQIASTRSARVSLHPLLRPACSSRAPPPSVLPPATRPCSRSCARTPGGAGS